MKGDLYVSSAIVDLSEGQSSHIPPVLEGGANGRFDIFPLHVRCVVVYAVGQTPLSPIACKRKFLFYRSKLITSIQVSYLHFCTNNICGFCHPLSTLAVLYEQKEYLEN